MPKKKLNLLLLIIVIAIWGGLLYKFVFPFFSSASSQVNLPATKPELTFEKKLIARDTFDLLAVDYDPFLAKNSFKPKVTTKVNRKKKAVKMKKVIWPKIDYLGFVKSKSNKAKLGLVRINKQLKRVRPGDVIKGVKIYSVSADSIGILNGKERKYFAK